MPIVELCLLLLDVCEVVALRAVFAPRQDSNTPAVSPVAGGIARGVEGFLSLTLCRAILVNRSSV